LKPAAFSYHSPASVDEALDVLAELGDDAKVLAGGQSLVPMLSMRLAVFAHLVDIGRVAGLSSLDVGDQHVTVGATTADSLIERDAELAVAVPLLVRVTPYIGHPAIRNRGTFGGSIAHADPAGEYPAVAVALDGVMRLRSTRAERTVGAADFFTGLWSTVMEPDELLVDVTFSRWKGRCGFSVQEHARRHGDFAIAGAVAGVALGAEDRVERAAVVMFGMSSTPVRACQLEADVTGRPAGECDPEHLGALAASEVHDVVSDMSGSGAYRLRVGAAMVARAWAAAMEEAMSA